MRKNNLHKTIVYHDTYAIYNDLIDMLFFKITTYDMVCNLYGKDSMAAKIAFDKCNIYVKAIKTFEKLHGITPSEVFEEVK